jgi:hypothetical protein
MYRKATIELFGCKTKLSPQAKISFYIEQFLHGFHVYRAPPKYLHRLFKTAPFSITRVLPPPPSWAFPNLL